MMVLINWAFTNINKSVPFRPEVPTVFQEVKVPRLHDNGLEWQ